MLLSGTGVYQDTAQYVCDEGFNLVGMSERVCQSDSTWSGYDPTCNSKYIYQALVIALHSYLLTNCTWLFNTAAQCPTLTSPMNGSLLISGTGAGIYQETATYSCETGFNLVGMSERVCQSDGTWSRSDPTCQSKYTFSVTIGTSCNTIFLSTQLLCVPL